MKTTHYNLIKNKVFILILLFTSLLLQSQIMVDNNIGVNANYSDLQTAIDAATPNSTIYVQPSPDSYGNITIEKPLTLVGRSHSEDNFISTIGNITITYNGSGTNIKGLHIYTITLTGLGGTQSSAPILVNNITIENNIISTINIPSIAAYNIQQGYYDTSGANNILVRGNVLNSSLSLHAINTIITNNWVAGYLYIYRPDSIIMTNNVFTHSEAILNESPSTGNALVQNCMFLTYNSAPVELSMDNTQLDNCLTYNYGVGTFGVSSTATNMVLTNALLNTDPLFTSITYTTSINFNKLDNYILQAGSPAIGSGFNNEDIGIFGNGYLFNNFGNPSGIPTTTILTSTASVPQNGMLQVNFKSTSH